MTDSVEPTFHNVSLYKLRSFNPERTIGQIIAAHPHYVDQGGVFDWEQGEWQVKIYKAKNPNASSFAYALKSKLGEGEEIEGYSVHFLCLLFNSSELFALTTGSAWQAVKRYAVHAFPLQIAKRLCEPKLLSLDDRPLAGPKLSSEVSFKPDDPYNLSAHEMDSIWRFFHNFKTSFCFPSSFYELPIFNEQRPLKRQKTGTRVGVLIRGSSLRLDLQTTMPNYQKILSHFAKIGRGEKTWSTNAKGELEEEKDQIAFNCFDNVERVEDAELREELREMLLLQLWKNFQKAGASSTLCFAHFHYLDYFRSIWFTLKFRDEETTFSYPPSFSEVMWWINDCLEDVGDLSIFRNRVKEMRLTFSADSKKSCSLLTLLQGEVAYKGVLYFHVDGMWLKVSGEHLAILQRDFHQMVKRCLLEDHLQHPWVANKEWTSFAAEDLSPEGQADLAALKGKTFRFVGCGYLTHAILNGGKLDKKIKKNWEGLNLLLQRPELTVADVETIFSKREEAEEVLRRLEAERPILEEKSSTGHRQQVLGDNGEILFADVRSLHWTPLIRDRLEEVERAFRQPTLFGQPIRVKFPLLENKVITALHKGGLTKSKRYFLTGPVDSPHLAPHHQNFRSIADEERYNRSYLGEPCHLVGDQVFGGASEKIELFDILRWDGEHLYLYHVKSGFGQSTRDAASQLRNAAQAIRNAIEKGSFGLLHRLCRNIMKTDNTSPFRQALRRKMESLPGEGSIEERFIALFSRPKRQIVFVYAFLDDGEKERLLSSDGNPHHQFTDMPPILQEKGFLDAHWRVTGKFLNTTAQQFQSELGLSAQRAKALRSTLKGQCSRFHSVIAKVELLQVRREVEEEHGFSFEVCQIRRSTEPVKSEDDDDETHLFDTLSPPKGFVNDGNLCFANCLMQVMKAMEHSPSSSTPLQQSALSALEPSPSGLPVKKLLTQTQRAHPATTPWDNGWIHDFLEFYETVAPDLNLPAAHHLNSHETDSTAELPIDARSEFLPIAIDRGAENDAVSHPVQITPIVETDSNVYELVAFVKYIASPRHYIAYRKVGEGWIECNDEQITPVDIEELLPTIAPDVVFALYRIL